MTISSTLRAFFPKAPAHTLDSPAAPDASKGSPRTLEDRRFCDVLQVHLPRYLDLAELSRLSRTSRALYHQVMQPAIWCTSMRREGYPVADTSDFSVIHAWGRAFGPSCTTLDAIWQSEQNGSRQVLSLTGDGHLKQWQLHDAHIKCVKNNTVIERRADRLVAAHLPNNLPNVPLPLVFVRLNSRRRSNATATYFIAPDTKQRDKIGNGHIVCATDNLTYMALEKSRSRYPTRHFHNLMHLGFPNLRYFGASGPTAQRPLFASPNGNVLMQRHGPSMVFFNHVPEWPARAGSFLHFSPDMDNTIFAVTHHTGGVRTTSVYRSTAAGLEERASFAGVSCGLSHGSGFAVSYHDQQTILLQLGASARETIEVKLHRLGDLQPVFDEDPDPVAIWSEDMSRVAVCLRGGPDPAVCMSYP